MINTGVELLYFLFEKYQPGDWIDIKAFLASRYDTSSLEEAKKALGGLYCKLMV